MKKFDVVNGPKSVPAIILGCMRMPSLSVKEAENIISVSLELEMLFLIWALSARM